MRVIWICHFSNEEIREEIPLKNFYISNKLRKVFNKPIIKYVDCGPVVNALLKEITEIDNIELHIISPHIGLKKMIHRFNRKGINYYFYNLGGPIIVKPFQKAIKRFVKPRYLIYRFIIKRLIKKINPDIINLIGTESPYYSLTALDVHKYPLFVSVQTIYTNPDRQSMSGNVDINRWEAEISIIQKSKYFGCTGVLHKNLLLNINPSAIIYKMIFPVKIYYNVVEVPKVYDIVFFAAGVTKKKGAEDAIKAFSIIVRQNQNTTMNIVGRCAGEYKEYLEHLIDKHNIKKNITFTEFFPLQKDMHQHIKLSKFALLPAKLDVLASTIIEAILLDIPVVTYKTCGTEQLNKEKECVLLSELNDYKDLAKNMIKLMNSPDLAVNLKINAKEVVMQKLDSQKAVTNLIEIYNSVVANYRNNISIPQNLLFMKEGYF